MPIVKSFTNNGTSDTFALHNNVISAYGTFGSGTLTLRKKVAGTWYTFADADSTAGFQVTANATAMVEGNHTCDFSLSGATNPNIVCSVE